jgi:hypothetical protein
MYFMNIVECRETDRRCFSRSVSLLSSQCWPICQALPTKLPPRAIEIARGERVASIHSANQDKPNSISHASELYQGACDAHRRILGLKYFNIVAYCNHYSYCKQLIAASFSYMASPEITRRHGRAGQKRQKGAWSYVFCVFPSAFSLPSSARRFIVSASSYFP